MGFEIEDGKGTGRKAEVDQDFRLRTFAVTHTGDQHVNVVGGKVWSVNVENLSPTAADDYILYIKNTGDVPLHISDIRLSAETAATQIKVHGVSGPAAGGSDVTPVSRTIGSASLPTATIQSGVDITGLTDEGVLFYIQCDTVGKEEHLSTTSKIRIPKGKAIALSVETATASITGTVSLVEEEFV